jgi:CRISPR type III-A-associated protein Csm2
MDMFTFTTNPPKCSCDSSLFPLGRPTAALFDKTAETLAKEISEPQVLDQKEEWSDREKRRVKVWKVVNERDANKPTQIRKFYDELVMWADKTRTAADLEKNLPFIKMMNAKVAYARGRDYVDDKFMTWFSSCMNQISAADEASLSTFQNFRTLFEAFLGFYKVVRPK